MNQTSEHRQIFQQRNDADYDHNDARDLFRSSVERKHIDQIQNQYDDEKRDQNADKDCHANPR